MDVLRFESEVRGPGCFLGGLARGLLEGKGADPSLWLGGTWLLPL